VLRTRDLNDRKQAELDLRFNLAGPFDEPADIALDPSLPVGVSLIEPAIERAAADPAYLAAVCLYTPTLSA
jgi:hypothetical protein